MNENIAIWRGRDGNLAQIFISRWGKSQDKLLLFHIVVWARQQEDRCSGSWLDRVEMWDTQSRERCRPRSREANTMGSD